MLEVNIVLIAFFIILFLVLFLGVKIVPQQNAWVLERLGRFSRVMEPGLNIIIPFIDRVSYKHSLKEQAIDIRSQSAITKDNVTLEIDGIIYVRILDPKQASYGVNDPYFALVQLAQTTMRSEIGKITLDNTFEEREALNLNIVDALNQASATWGIQCMRYEIRDINPPKTILNAMEQQVTAERKKRAVILESEGDKQSRINIAEGLRQEQVLLSEAIKIEQINRAEGEASAILAVAEATAQSIERIADSCLKSGGSEAVSLKLAEQYISAFGNLAKESNTVILPAQANDVASLVTQGLSVFEALKQGNANKARGTSSKNVESKTASKAKPIYDLTSDSQSSIEEIKNTAKQKISEILEKNGLEDNNPWS